MSRVIRVLKVARLEDEIFSTTTPCHHLHNVSFLLLRAPSHILFWLPRAPSHILFWLLHAPPHILFWLLRAPSHSMPHFICRMIIAIPLSPVTCILSTGDMHANPTIIALLYIMCAYYIVQYLTSNNIWYYNAHSTSTTLMDPVIIMSDNAVLL